MSTRRDFVRQSAAAAAGSVAGIPIAVAQTGNAYADASQLTWSKAPCRFCGTGCGVTVAVKNNRVVATQGDPEAEVNKGLNCVKGYFLSKIMYGDDRLTTPLLRMKNGQYAKWLAAWNLSNEALQSSKVNPPGLPLDNS